MEDNKNAYDGGEGADDEEGICEDDGDDDSEVLFNVQLDISSGWFVCEDWSIRWAEMSTFFLKDERKNDWVEPRFGYLPSDDIKRNFILFLSESIDCLHVASFKDHKETNH